MKTALLISTYNWPEALNLVLLSVKKQTVLPDEILIADDGSKEDTKQLIDKFKKQSDLPIKHIWHEDKGFRRSKILNKTIASTDADYIIQTDGDCIVHSRFIEDHLSNISENMYLYGTRVGISADYVEEVFEKQLISFGYFSKQIKSRGRALHIPLLSHLYKKHKDYSRRLRGCNLSFWRKDFIAVNGYNEDFEGWGKEDSDLAIRLHNNSLHAKRLRYVGIVYHIHHQVSSKENLAANEQIQKNTIESKIIRCKKGVDQYL